MERAVEPTDPDEAHRAVEEATQAVTDARRRWPEVLAVTAAHERERRRDGFADRIRAAMQGKG